MAFKKLPIIIKPLITSECWTFYKMAIIQTLPNYDSWLCNHFKFYTNEDGESYFGDIGNLHPLSYFSDILEIRDEKILSVPSNQIIDFIINKINQGTYLIIDTNLCKLRNITDSPLYFHETLVYGYDTTKKELLILLLIDDSFKEVTVPYESFQDSYEDIINYYLRNKDRIFNRRLYYYGITSLKPIQNYKNDNACYDFIQKLIYEYTGTLYTTQSNPFSADTCNNHSYYTGLSCTTLLINKLTEIQEVPTTHVLENLKTSCLKNYENHHIILVSLEWFYQKYATDQLELKNLIAKYTHCCNLLYNCVLLFYKNSFFPNPNIFTKIVNMLTTINKTEKDILKETISILIKIYTNYLYSFRIPG